MDWRKSSYSMNHGDCLEVGQDEAAVAVRDSKDRAAGPVLAFPAEVWREFAGRVKRDGPGARIVGY